MFKRYWFVATLVMLCAVLLTMCTAKMVGYSWAKPSFPAWADEERFHYSGSGMAHGHGMFQETITE